MKKKETGTSVAGDGEKKKPAVFRLQDKALQEMRDDGVCLSMHQPWATLLIAGIKRWVVLLLQMEAAMMCNSAGTRGGHGTHPTGGGFGSQPQARNHLLERSHK